MSFDSTFERFPVLTSQRLILREIVPADYPQLHGIFSDPEVMRYFGFEPQQSRDEAKVLVQRFRQGYEARRAIRWGITLKGADKIIGTCGLHNLSKRDRKAEVGYDLLRGYWGQGIMTEAAQALLAHAFNQMGLNRIEALVEPPNLASIRLVEKLGFTREGLMREYAIYGGEVRDCCVYGLLRGEYRGQTS